MVERTVVEAVVGEPPHCPPRGLVEVTGEVVEHLAEHGADLAQGSTDGERRARRIEDARVAAIHLDARADHRWAEIDTPEAGPLQVLHMAGQLRPQCTAVLAERHRLRRAALGAADKDHVRGEGVGALPDLSAGARRVDGPGRNDTQVGREHRCEQ